MIIDTCKVIMNNHTCEIIDFIDGGNIIHKLITDSRKKIKKKLIFNQDLKTDYIQLFYYNQILPKFKHSKVFILWFLNTDKLVKKKLGRTSHFQPACLYLEIRGRTLRWKLRLCVGNSSVDKIYIIRPKPGPVAKNATPRSSGWESNPRPLDTRPVLYHWATEAVADNLGASSVYSLSAEWYLLVFELLHKILYSYIVIVDIDE